MCRITLLVLLALFHLPGLLSAENWPCWRGPRGDGTSLETNIPVEWNAQTGKNVVWKIPVPGTGHSSPVTWDDRIFLVSFLEESNERLLLCISRKDGSILWQKTVFKAPPETRHQLNSFASGTPAVDGKTIYVSFLEVDGREIPAPNVGTPRPVTPGEMLVAAYDFDGNERWKVKPGPFISAHGYCSSPVIYQDLLIINGDHDGDSYVVALHRATGEVAWKIPREHKIRSYCTPIIREVAGKTQLVLSGSKQIVGLDPRSGTRIWNIEGPAEQFVASMVSDGSLFFMVAGFPTHHVMAVRPDGMGDVTATHVAWQNTDAKCFVPSPVLTGDYLFVADDRGTVNCFDKNTGRRLWQDRLGMHYSASLVTAGGLVYFTADDGETAVVRPGPKLDVLHKNPLGEYTYASPAISDGQILIRGEKHLFAIGN
jgi:outer membrane protein assembly factor BamB